MQNPSEIPFLELLNALRDEETPFNPRFLYRLSDLNQDEIDQLADIWPSISEQRRQAILEDLEEVGEADFLLSYEAIARLALNDPNPFVRASAVRLLWDFEKIDLAVKFMQMLESDQNEEVRAAVASALGRYIYLGETDEIPDDVQGQVEDSLINTIKGEDASLVRRRALESMGYSSRKEVAPLIENAYASQDKEWISSALFAMGRSADDRWYPQVLESLESIYPLVREEAARAAGELEIQEAVPTLIDMLNDDNEDVRAAAIWSLSQVGGEGVRDLLEELHETADDDAETDFLEAALDNLAFNEDVQLMPMFNFPEDNDSDEEDDEEDLIDLYGADLDDLDDEGDIDEDLED